MNTSPNLTSAPQHKLIVNTASEYLKSDMTSQMDVSYLAISLPRSLYQSYIFQVLYSCEQKIVLLFRKSEILHSNDGITNMSHICLGTKLFCLSR